MLPEPVVGAGLQPSVLAAVVNLVVPAPAGKLPLWEMEIVQLPSSAWPEPLAGVLGIHEGELVGRQITLARVAGRLPVAFSDTPY